MSVPKFEGKRRSPIEAIRAFCVWCCGGSRNEVSLCPAGPDKRHPCDLWPYRFGSIPPGASRSLLKVIKARCLDCLPGAEHTPKDCDAYQPYEIHPPCPIWPYRLGKNPYISDKTRQARRERGKIQCNFTAPQADSGSRINPVNINDDNRAAEDSCENIALMLAEAFGQSSDPEARAMGKVMQLVAEREKSE